MDLSNFADSPPFGLHDIFNKAIGLASYKSYDVYRLFDSLKTVRLKDSGVHVYRQGRQSIPKGGGDGLQILKGLEVCRPNFFLVDTLKRLFQHFWGHLSNVYNLKYEQKPIL